MIQRADNIDRKIIALIGNYKAAITKIIDWKIGTEFFLAEYRQLVQYMLDYYKLHCELITEDALMELLVAEYPEDISTATAIGAAFSDIVHKQTDAESIEHKDELSELDFFIDRIKNRRIIELLADASINLAKSVKLTQLDKAREILVTSITTIDSIRSPIEVQEGNISDFVDERIQDYDDRKNNPEKYQGIYSGFPVLDKETDGYQKGELIIYVAAPGGGKSASLLHSSFHAWKQKNPSTDVGANVVLFTLEMFRKAYMRRFDAMHASLDTNKLKSASLDDHEYTAWRRAMEFQRTKPNFFHIVDIPSGCTTLFIRNKLDEVRLRYPDNPIDLIVIDYMGIMETPKSLDSDWLRQGYISQECKELARSEKLPVLTAIQETRDSIKDKKKVKDTSTLARSQMIAANADIIISVEKEVIENKDGNFQILKEINDFPNTLIYQNIKHRDGKQLRWRAGVEWSRMLIQPMAFADGEKPEEESKVPKLIVPPKTIITPKAITTPNIELPEKNNDLDTDDEFDLYYEQLDT